MSNLQWRRLGAGHLTVFLLGALGSCQLQRELPAPPPQPPSSSSPAPLVPVAAAPAVPMTQSTRLHQMVDMQIEGFFAKRADRMGRAVETGERGLVANTQSARFHRVFTPVEAHFNAGEELFEFDFGPAEGLGSGMGGKAPNFHRVHRGAHGGPDTTSCRGCHHRGGDDGAGEFTENALTGGDGQDTYNCNERNAPMLQGGGALQILAQEITEALALIAKPYPGVEFSRELVYQDVNFGTVKFRKDGSMDASQLGAIDADLIVRPFGWKGTHSSLRRFAEEAFQVHHGMQSEVLVDRRRFDGTLPKGSSPATAAVLRAMGDGPITDPDKDGSLYELNGRMLTSIAVYLTLLPLPVIEPPKAPDLLAAFRDGEAAFRQVGCASCHKPYWRIKSPVWREQGETPSSEDDLLLDLRKDIQRGPQLDNTDTLFNADFPVYIYSDLRRHDMGPELADTYDSGGHHKGDRIGPQIPPSYFLTRPLWGLADTGPYLHDGRAVTIPEAIAAHGGEAKAARDAYLRLDPARRRAVHVFLLSLTRPAVPEVAP